MKALTSMTIDVDVLSELRLRKIKVSTVVNDYLRTFLRLEKDKEKNVDDEIIALKARVMSLQAEKEKAKEKLDKEYQRKVEKGLIREI